MASVTTTPRGSALTGFAPGLEALEVRTEAIILEVREREDGALEIDARPVEPRRFINREPDRFRLTLRTDS